MIENIRLKGEVGELASALVSLVDHANGTYRKKILSTQTLIKTLEAVQSGSPLAWCWSLWRVNGFGDAGESTVAVCFRLQSGNCGIGVGSGPAKRASPGRVWADLKPWRPDRASQREKLEIWANSVADDRLIVPEQLFADTIIMLKRPEVLNSLRQADFSSNGFRYLCAQRSFEKNA